MDRVLRRALEQAGDELLDAVERAGDVGAVLLGRSVPCDDHLAQAPKVGRHAIREALELVRRVRLRARRLRHRRRDLTFAGDGLAPFCRLGFVRLAPRLKLRAPFFKLRAPFCIDA